MNSAEDFIQIVLECYIVVAAEEIMSMKAVEIDWDGKVNSLARLIVNMYVRMLPDAAPKIEDQGYNYSCEIITLGLLWFNYLDSTKEGDGGRVMALWKFLMVIFRKTGHRNYAKEAASLLIEYHFTASERKAAQMRDSRFINTKGREGCDMACDLFMEHLNRRLKGMIRQMGASFHS